MKNFHKITFFTVLLLLVLSLSSCGGEQSDGGNALMLSRKSITFSEIGESLEVNATVLSHEDGTSVEWSTSDDGVAVCDGGTITATGFGVCVVRATYGGVSATCTVNVPNPNPPLSLSASELFLDNIGRTAKLTAMSDMGEDISGEVSWIISNPKVVTVENGIVTATGYGSCAVLAIAKQKTAMCLVTVDDPTAPALQLSENELELKVGEEHTLSVSAKNNANGVFSWISSDSEIAECTDDGKVTGKKRGVCVIIATNADGDTDACVVTVGGYKNYTPPSDLLNFEFRDLYKKLSCVNKNTGKVMSSSLVYSYDMSTLLLDDGRLVVEITLNCVKIYDAKGADEGTQTILTYGLYRENDVLCEKKQKKLINLKVGDKFTVKCSGFTVQTAENTVREFYMTFSSITEA